MTDRAAAMAQKMRGDAQLLSTGRMLGVEPEDLLPKSEAAFRSSPDEPNEVVRLRQEHHERLRQELAKEVSRHHQKLSHEQKRLERSASAGPGGLSQSAASLLSGSASQQKLVEDDRRLLTNLRRRREKTPDEWFEKQYQKAAVKEERAVQRHMSVLEMQRQHRARLSENQQRAFQRNEDKRREEMLKEEVGRKALEERLERAAKNKEADLHEQERQLQQSRENNSRKTLKLSQSLQSLDDREADRVRRLHRKFDSQEAVKERTMRQKQQDAAIRAERARLLQQDRQGRRARDMVAKMVQDEMVRSKHRYIDEKMGVLNEQKKQMMRQRKISSIRSTLERQAIIVNSQGEWKDRLRWQPLPENPDELIATMGI